jgi:hypothetical protein
MASKIEEDRERDYVITEAHQQWEVEKNRLLTESQINELQRRKVLVERRQKEEEQKVHFCYCVFFIMRSNSCWWSTSDAMPI